MEMMLRKDDYSKLTISELTALLRKASTKDEQKFFVTILNEVRSEAAKKVIR